MFRCPRNRGNFNPGLFLLVTGTSAFFDGPQGVQRLPPLAQRVHTDFATDARFDNPRAVQIRLPGFDLDALVQVGARVRDLFAEQATQGARVRAVIDNAYLEDLARAVAGRFGGRAGWRLAFSSRSLSRTFLTELISLRTSTRGGIMRQPLMNGRCPSPSVLAQVRHPLTILSLRRETFRAASPRPSIPHRQYAGME